MPQAPSGFLQTYAPLWQNAAAAGSRGVDQGTRSVDLERQRQFLAQQAWSKRQFEAPLMGARITALQQPLSTGYDPVAAQQWAQHGVRVPADQIGINVEPQRAAEAATTAGPYAQYGVTGPSLEPGRKVRGEAGPKQFAPPKPWHGFAPRGGGAEKDLFHPYFEDELTKAQQTEAQQADDRRAALQISLASHTKGLVHPDAVFTSPEDKAKAQYAWDRAINEAHDEIAKSNGIPFEPGQDAIVQPETSSAWGGLVAGKPEVKAWSTGTSPALVEALNNHRSSPEDLRKGAFDRAVVTYNNRPGAPKAKPTPDGIAAEIAADPAFTGNGAAARAAFHDRVKAAGLKPLKEDDATHALLNAKSQHDAQAAGQ